MKILLVRPPRIKQAITLSELMFSEPIGLEMIYNAIKDEHEVEIFDMMIEKISLSKKLREYMPEIIGITSLCIDVNMVRKLADEAKEYNERIITIIGGTQSYLNPEAFFQDSVDHIFMFTNRENLSEFFRNVNKGLTNPIAGVLSKELNYNSVPIKGRNEYMLPDRTSTDKYRHQYSYFGYRPAAIAQFGTGCEKSCDFCLRWRIEGRREKINELELIKKDLMSIKESTIMFFDNDFFASEEKLMTFIDVAIELGLKKNYIVYGSVKGIIEYKEQLKTLKELGLKAVLIGYETFKDGELDTYNKKSTVSDNQKAAAILKDLKIDAWASFMAHPDWSVEDFRYFRRYIKKLSPEISSISPLTPFPNLPMYNKYRERLIYEMDDFEKWSFGQVMIEPSKITLKRYYYELLKTNLYVNLFINKKTEMINSYGFTNILRLLKGSLSALNKYIVLMIKAKS
jgi:radical SAM superfamily enzyme YgiQ (UPF0313 family)